jgi:hypothetical protein
MVFAPMHTDLYHYEKRIMMLENFCSEFSSPKEPEQKFVVLIENNSSVLQCKIDDLVISKFF